MVFIAITAGVGVLVGIMSPSWIRYFLQSRKIQAAKFQAEEYLDQAKSQVDQLAIENKALAEEIEHEAREQFEKEELKFDQRIRELKQKIQEREDQFDREQKVRERAMQKKQSQVDEYDRQLRSKDQSVNARRRIESELKQKYQDSLLQASHSDLTEIKKIIAENFEQETRVTVTKQAQLELEELQIDSEKLAKRIIGISINRFARAYCPERGIGYVGIPEGATEKVLGPDKSHLLLVEKTCGVDIIYNEQNQSLSVSGFDPVRRELGRASLERIVKQKHLDESRILTIVEQAKQDLFRKIRGDGKHVAKELGLSGVHDEVLNMMGGLRYRYSFTQNQYFHCIEVGFLCGLLSSELGLPIKNGRRAGLLHDIGKAMDHSIDGGHAVIGADFIEKNGEAPEIVHAVRAHHYDETPSTDLAFLVIAADAISGARPGARRSTVDSYMQKMDQLQVIGNSFDGVLNTYVLSAGREVRVIVDSHRVDDLKSLQLSREIAKKIEDECNYPGQIKVIVVRETQAVEMAK